MHPQNSLARNPEKYPGLVSMMFGFGPFNIDVVDRLAHIGGLSGTVTTAQTVGLDLQTLSGTGNLTARIGPSNYSDVRWVLEWYAATGATAVTATVNVTYNDGTTGNLNAISLAANRPIYSFQNLNQFIPQNLTNRYIRAVNTVTLSGTTGTAGNFGVTAMRKLATIS